MPCNCNSSLVKTLQLLLRYAGKKRLIFRLGTLCIFRGLSVKNGGGGVIYLWAWPCVNCCCDYYCSPSQHWTLTLWKQGFSIDKPVNIIFNFLLGYLNIITLIIDMRKTHCEQQTMKYLKSQPSAPGSCSSLFSPHQLHKSMLHHIINVKDFVATKISAAGTKSSKLWRKNRKELSVKK